jgi:hypothetical protein
MAEPKWIAQVLGDGIDPAIDLDAPKAAELVAKYARSRADADRMALPLKPGQKLRLWGVADLTEIQYGAIEATSSGYPRLRLAFQYACRARKDPPGETLVEAPTQGDGEQKTARNEWLEDAKRVGGTNLIKEIGHVVMQRAEVASSAVDPFGWPPGLPPGR